MRISIRNDHFKRRFSHDTHHMTTVIFSSDTTRKPPLSLITSILAVLLLAGCGLGPEADSTASPETLAMPSPATAVPTNPRVISPQSPAKPSAKDPTPTRIPTHDPTLHDVLSPALTQGTSLSSSDRIPITIRNAATLQMLAEVNNAPLHKLHFSSPKTLLAVAHPDRIHIYHVNTFAEFLLDVPGVITPVFSPVRRPTALAAASKDGGVYLHDLGTGDTIILSSSGVPVHSLAFAPDGLILAILKANEIVELWSATDGKLIKTIDLSTTPSLQPSVRSLQFAPDGFTLALISTEHSIISLWDISTGLLLRTLEWSRHAGPLYDVAFTSDWSTMAWISRSTVQIMDYNSGELGPSLDHEDAVSSWQFSPDGGAFSVRSAEYINEAFRGVVKLWDTATGEAMHTLVHPDFVSSLEFTHDWKVVASSSSGDITLWDVSSGTELRTLSGHTDTVWDLDFSPGSDLLASASSDGTVRLWGIANGTELATLSRHTANVLMVHFSQDVHTVMSAAEDGTIYLWGTDKLN